MRDDLRAFLDIISGRGKHTALANGILSGVAATCVGSSIPAVVLVIMVCSNVWNSRGVDATVDCLCRSHGGIISRLPAFSSFLS